MVIINNDKNIWPLYIPPENDELFSSWFCRLSNNHLIRSESFLTNYFGRMLPLWNRDIDMLMPEKYINIIYNHTPMNYDQIKNLFLPSVESFAFDKANGNGITMNILILGIKHRKRKLNGILFCPKCLNKPIAYFKKRWRFSTSIICSECNSYLIDECPFCKKPISYHRNNINNINNSTSNCNPLNICECGFDLSTYEEVEQPKKSELNYQNFINETISNGYNHHSQYSFLYIKGLIMLSYYIIRESNSNDLEYIFRIAKINRSDFYELPYFLESKIINK